MKCIVSFEDKAVVQELQTLGYQCIPVVKSAKVSEPISCHADILYLKTDDKNIIISSCQKENMHFLKDSGLNVTMTDKLSPGYKQENYLNVVNCGNTLIYNPKVTTVCEEFHNTKEKIDVKQGYTRCSTIAICENAFITEDIGIYKALKASKKDCLLLTKGFVKLDGYAYGFIGGATVMLQNDVLLFFGDIADHPDKDRIIEFLNKYKVTPHFIKNKALVDVGSAVMIVW